MKGDRPDQTRRGRRRRRRAEVVHMPPPWRRSLVESGMSPRLKPVDKIVIALFPILVVAVLVVLVAAT